MWPYLEYAIGTDNYPRTPHFEFIYYLRTARWETISPLVGTIHVRANAQTSVVNPSFLPFLLLNRFIFAPFTMRYTLVSTLAIAVAAGPLAEAQQPNTITVMTIYGTPKPTPYTQQQQQQQQQPRPAPPSQSARPNYATWINGNGGAPRPTAAAPPPFALSPSQAPPYQQANNPPPFALGPSQAPYQAPYQGQGSPPPFALAPGQNPQYAQGPSPVQPYQGQNNPPPYALSPGQQPPFQAGAPRPNQPWWAQPGVPSPVGGAYSAPAPSAPRPAAAPWWGGAKSVPASAATARPWNAQPAPQPAQLAPWPVAGQASNNPPTGWNKAPTLNNGNGWGAPRGN